MKILYCVQLTGNGHITRANELIPEFKKVADVDILTSGNQNSLEIKHKVRYNYRGISFVFGLKGGIAIFKTIINFRPFTFLKDIFTCPVRNYDLIINDFEPVSAWACKINGMSCYSMSHQYSLIYKNNFPTKKNNFFQYLILKYFAPSKNGIGFDYMNNNLDIFYPIIKYQFRLKKFIEENHYIIYLPSYSIENIYSFFSKINNVKWIVFSPKITIRMRQNNLDFFPTDYKVFENSMLSCKGVVTNAGFETTSEALHLGKKLLVLPIKNQFEQKYNALILKEMGIKILEDLNSERLGFVKDWVISKKFIERNYNYDYKLIIRKTLLDHDKTKNPSNKMGF